jgi:hypothetical protein
MTECEGALEVVEFIRMSLIQPLYGMAHHHAARPEPPTLMC